MKYLPILFLASCSQIEPNTPERELCWAEARASFHARTLECETEECIDIETEQEKKDQEACP